MESSSLDAERGHESFSSPKSGTKRGIRRPPVLLVILFWHHVISVFVTIWCAIGIVVAPSWRTSLAMIFVVVSVQALCAFPGLFGSLQRNTKFIYYFAAAQAILGAVEFFWAIASLFVPTLLMLFVLLSFCLYQVFLCVSALRCSLKECEWPVLAYVWPFDMGTHPNYLPSFADKANDRPSLYGTLSETRAAVDADGLKPVYMFTPLASPKASFHSSATVPVDALMMSQHPAPSLPSGSMHPAGSDLSSTSSTKSQQQQVSMNPDPRCTTPPTIRPKVADDNSSASITAAFSTAIERPSSITAIAKTSSTTSKPTVSATVNKASTQSGNEGEASIMERIFGQSTALTAPRTTNPKTTSKQSDVKGTTAATIQRGGSSATHDLKKKD